MNMQRLYKLEREACSPDYKKLTRQWVKHLMQWQPESGGRGGRPAHL